MRWRRIELQFAQNRQAGSDGSRQQIGYERLLVVHYPPYCSKFNPIEHRLFSQINRSWRGASLMSLRDAADRAAMTTTKKGLLVHVHINSETYNIRRPIDELDQRRLNKQVIFATELGKWNYLVKPDY